MVASGHGRSRVDDIANFYMVAYRLLSHAFVLPDRRRTKAAALS